MCTAIIDTSAIVWDRTAFESNGAPYYELSEQVSNLLETLTREQPILIMDSAMRDLIIDGFPMDVFPKFFDAYGYTVLEFFGNINPEKMVSFIRKDIGVSSEPNLAKKHFSPDLQLEVKYSVNYIHTNASPDSVLFTFSYLWPNNQKLSTESYF